MDSDNRPTPPMDAQGPLYYVGPPITEEQRDAVKAALAKPPVRILENLKLTHIALTPDGPAIGGWITEARHE